MGDVIKLKAVGNSYRNDSWDEMGRRNISKIYISHGDELYGLQFAYVEGSSTVLSAKHGVEGHKYDMVTLDYPSEYITGISGKHGFCEICTITFHTNRRTFGPYGESNPYHYPIDYNLQFGTEFYGFHGYNHNVIRKSISAIGAYLKPSTSPSNLTAPTPTSTSVEIESSKG